MPLINNYILYDPPKNVQIYNKIQDNNSIIFLRPKYSDDIWSAFTFLDFSELLINECGHANNSSILLSSVPWPGGATPNRLFLFPNSVSRDYYEAVKKRLKAQKFYRSPESFLNVSKQEKWIVTTVA